MMSERRRSNAPRSPFDKLDDALTWVAKLNVAIKRRGRTADDTDDKIRDRIRDDLKAAFKRSTVEVKTLPLRMPDGDVQRTRMVSLVGTFGMVLDHFGIDRRDPWAQESVFRVVMAAVDEGLADPECVMKDKS
jgi:hypothetical protein